MHQQSVTDRAFPFWMQGRLVQSLDTIPGVYDRKISVIKIWFHFEHLRSVFRGLKIKPLPIMHVWEGHEITEWRWGGKFVKFVHFQKLRDVRNCVTQPILIEMLCDCCLLPMGIDVLPNGFSNLSLQSWKILSDKEFDSGGRNSQEKCASINVKCKGKEKRKVAERIKVQKYEKMATC